MMFDRPAMAKSPTWLLPAVGVAAIALLLTVLAWPTSALVRRHYGAPYRLEGQDAKAHRWIRIASTGVVALLIVWAMTVTKMMGDLSLLTAGTDGWVWILQLLSLVVFLGGAAFGIWNAMVVVRGPRKWYAKTWAVVLAVSLLVMLWVALAFHLIAFDVNY